MTVKEFIENGCKADTLNVKEYIPYLEKVTRAETLVKKTSFDDNGDLKLNTPAKYMFHTLTIVDMYTDIDVDFTNAPEEYDLLRKSNIDTTVIFNAIPKNELEEFDMLVDMIAKDLVFNVGTPQAYISRQVERFTTIASTTLTPVLEKLGDQIENLDDKQIEKLGKTLNKAFKVVK